MRTLPKGEAGEDAAARARGECIRLAVNISLRVGDELAALRAMRHNTATDVVGRAISTLYYLETCAANGARLVMEHPDGTRSEVVFR